MALGKSVDDFLLTRAIALFGHNLESYDKLITRYENLGWMDEALSTCRKALEFHPATTHLHRRLAALALRAEGWTEAENAARTTIELEPEHPTAYFTLGWLREREANFDVALELYRKAMQRGLSDPHALNAVAKSFTRAELYEEAVGAYKEIVRVSPKNIPAYGVMAATYAKLKRYPEALEAYKHVVRLQPTADAYGILASAYVQMGNYREAVRAYQAAVRLEPGLAQTYNRLSEIYIKLEDFEKNHNTEGAENPAKEKVLAKLRREQQALESFKDAIRARPDDPRPYHAVAQLYCDLELPLKAIDLEQHALRLNPKESSYYCILGRAYIMAGKLDYAVKALKQALRLSPNDGEIWSAIGLLHSRQNKWDDAERAFEKAMKLKAQGYAFYVQLGDIYRQRGKYNEATKVYSQAIQLRPQDAPARYGLGVTLVRMGMRPKALEQHAILRTIDTKVAKDLSVAIWRSATSWNK